MLLLSDLILQSILQIFNINKFMTSKPEVLSRLLIDIILVYCRLEVEHRRWGLGKVMRNFVKNAVYVKI